MLMKELIEALKTWEVFIAIIFTIIFVIFTLDAIWHLRAL